MKTQTLSVVIEKVAEFLQSAYGSLVGARIAPAYLVALESLALAAFALNANRRRTANQIWAATFVLGALYHGGIGLLQLYHRVLCLRLAMAVAFLSLLTGSLLVDAIGAPWAGLPLFVRKARSRLWIVLLGPLSFTPWYISYHSPAKHYTRSPFFWAVEALGVAIILGIFGSAYRLWRRPGLGIRTRIELAALMCLYGPGSIVQVGLNAVGRRLNWPNVAWFSPLIAVAEMTVCGLLLAVSNGSHSSDLPRQIRASALRAVLYALGGIGAMAGCAFAISLGPAAVVLAIGLLTFCVMLQPAADRALRRALDTPLSDRFGRAQTAIRLASGEALDLSSLHERYRSILVEWSEGADRVFLSEGFAATWPAEPLPVRLVDGSLGGVATPEKLAVGGEEWRLEFDYLVRHRIGAVVCTSASDGDRLVGALGVRRHLGPFSEGELLEAADLLSAMQSGSQLVRMRQQLRGSDRLNFYARYAPQFAHELRNGLYLQTALMRAIAAGRLSDVRVTDAEAALERTEIIDRLCDHFFNVGTLFNRPIERFELRAMLEGFIERAGHQFDGGGRILLQSWLERSEDAEVLANAELLTMALTNLVKNALEADPAGSARVEIAVSRQLDQVHVLVRDRGPGLPSDRLADPFAPGRSHKREGMGLGLSVVRDCIEAMGGTIGLRSSGPQGTCFEITLGCAERVPAASAPCEFLIPHP